MLNVFDIGIILMLIMFFIIGIKRGVIKEIVSLVAILVVFILSFSLKGIVGNILCVIFPFLDFWGPFQGLVTLNIFFYQLIAFIIVFTISLFVYEIALKISNFLQKVVNWTVILVIPSKILGGVVSLIKGYVILFAIFLLLAIPLGHYSIFKDSKMISYMLKDTPLLAPYVKNFITPINEVIDLSEKVSKESISINDANLETLDIMLKYDVVDKKTINSLIEVEKLDSIEGIDSILNKY